MFPPFLQFLAIVAEFFGAVGLIVGFLTRIAALGIAVDMLVAAALVHIHYGFFMNWNTNKSGEGVEFFILGIAMAVALILKGAGAFSVDRAVYQHRTSGEWLSRDAHQVLKRL